MLCDICQGIEYDDLVREEPRGVYIGSHHHASFTELEACSNCDFCKAICEAVKSQPALAKGNVKWKHDPIHIRIFPSSTGDGDERDKSNLLVYFGSGRGAQMKEKVLTFFGIYIDRTRNELETGRIDTVRMESSLITARNVSKASNDDDCFIMARSWLKQCTGSKPHGLQEYEQKHVKVETFTPTRTIDVGPPEGTISPRLVSHNDQPKPEPIQWVTLSHSWGGSSPISTTIANLTKQQKSIPIFSMPKTFQDAILTTRKLGLRHLWIDSLCIIQDSPEDWKVEAAQMGKIYQYGLLNIAADTSPNCNGGLFHVRPSVKMDIILPLKSKKLGLETHMYARAGLWDRYRPYILDEMSTLTSRGWVLQEAILSPRTLHYAQQQLYWECEHVTLAEGNLDPIVTKALSRFRLGDTWVSHKLVLPRTLLEGWENVPDEREAVYRSWLQLIRNYASRKLTVPSDIFASLAGVASVFQQTLKEKYMAGIFEGDLIKGLLWRVIDQNIAVKRNMIGVPSWSWAALIGAIEFEIVADSNSSLPQSVGDLGARIIDAKVHQDDGTASILHEPLTNFTGGAIQLEGLMLDNTDQLTYIGTGFKSLGSTGKFQQPYQQTWYLDNNSVLEGAVLTDLAILHLGAWEWWVPISKSRFTRRFSGLVLRSVSGVEGTYERIGMVTLRFWFEDVVGPCGFESEDEKFLLEDRWKRKTIRLV